MSRNYKFHNPEGLYFTPLRKELINSLLAAQMSPTLRPQLSVTTLINN